MSTQTREVPLDIDVECEPHDPAASGGTVREVANLAYRYWVERQRNCIPGSDIGDWLRAESEFLQKRAAALDEASEERFQPATRQPANGAL